MKEIYGFLNKKRHKALHKAVRAMDNKTPTLHNKVILLENFMIMYGIYNAETLEQPINTVYHIHNTTSSNAKLFAGEQSSLTLRSLHANTQGIQHYSINVLLYLRTVKD